MTPSVQYLQDRFDHFNALCFEGRLPAIPIKIVEARTFFGKIQYKRTRVLFGGYRYSDFMMKISSSYDLPERDLEDVIIHEMIHYQILYFGQKDTSAHGALFRSIMMRINMDYGRNITVSKKIKQDVPKAVRNHLVAVSRMLSGEWGVTVCAKTKQVQLDHDIRRYYRVRDLRWCETNHPFFNKFPRSISAKVYRITEDEMQEIGIPIE